MINGSGCACYLVISYREAQSQIQSGISSVRWWDLRHDYSDIRQFNKKPKGKTHPAAIGTGEENHATRTARPTKRRSSAIIKTLLTLCECGYGAEWDNDEVINSEEICSQCLEPGTGMGQLISVWIILIFQETGLIQMLSLAGLETKYNIIFRFNRRDLLTCDPFWEQSTVESSNNCPACTTSHICDYLKNIVKTKKCSSFFYRADSAESMWSPSIGIIVLYFLDNEGAERGSQICK